jgi:hypothetical protein
MKSNESSRRCAAATLVGDPAFVHVHEDFRTSWLETCWPEVGTSGFGTEYRPESLVLEGRYGKIASGYGAQNQIEGTLTTRPKRAGLKGSRGVGGK